MNKQELCSFLENTFEDKLEFSNIYGSSKVYDAKFMLTADAVSENLELFAEAIKEKFDEQTTIYPHCNINKDNLVFA